jgi:putative transposase
MVTSATWGRRSLFQRKPWAQLLIDTLYHYRGSAYLLHEFIIMPDHVHVLLTPKTSLEKAVQFIKGGFSYRAKKELGSNMEVWQKGFSDHRIRDAEDYQLHVSYIRENPVRKRLCEQAEEFPWSSAYPGFELDAVPQGLKPGVSFALNGAAKAAPFQNNPDGAGKAAPFQSEPDQENPVQNNPHGAREGAPLKVYAGAAAEGATRQSRPVSGDKMMRGHDKNKIA